MSENNNNNVFLWQFSVSTQCALPTHSQFPSLHHNHSGHTKKTKTIIINSNSSNDDDYADNDMGRLRDNNNDNKSAKFNATLNSDVGCYAVGRLEWMVVCCS